MKNSEQALLIEYQHEHVPMRTHSHLMKGNIFPIIIASTIIGASLVASSWIGTFKTTGTTEGPIEMIMHLQRRIDLLQQEVAALSKPCGASSELQRSRRAVTPDVLTPAAKGNFSGVAKFTADSPPNNTMQGKWKVNSAGHRDGFEFSYFGDTISSWKPDVIDLEVFETSCYGVSVRQSGVYLISLHVTISTTRNIEAVKILANNKPLLVSQENTLAKVHRNVTYGYFAVFSPMTIAYLEAGTQLTVRTIDVMSPQTAVIITDASTQFMLVKLR